jgi:hypothetical protein
LLDTLTFIGYNAIAFYIINNARIKKITENRRKYHEKNLPTQKTSKEQSTRFPSKNEHEEWSQSSLSQKKKRQSKAQRIVNAECL